MVASKHTPCTAFDVSFVDPWACVAAQVTQVRREEQRRWEETSQRRQGDGVGSLTVARLQCYSSVIASNPRLDRGDKSTCMTSFHSVPSSLIGIGGFLLSIR
jgi:hypothetical protein